MSQISSKQLHRSISWSKRDRVLPVILSSCKREFLLFCYTPKQRSTCWRYGAWSQAHLLSCPSVPALESPVLVCPAQLLSSVPLACLLSEERSHVSVVDLGDSVGLLRPGGFGTSVGSPVFPRLDPNPDLSPTPSIRRGAAPRFAWALMVCLACSALAGSEYA